MTAVYPQDDIIIHLSDQNSIVIEYVPFYSDTSVVTIGNQRYRNIEINLGYIAEPELWGNPSIEERRINLGVPSEFGNTIEVISAEYKEIEGLILPKPKMVPNGEVNKNEYTTGVDYYQYQAPDELVMFGDFGITRGMNNQTIRLLPVKFNPEQRKIRLYKKIIFRINYTGVGKYVKQPYDELLSSALINYDAARYWQKERKGLNKVTVTSSLLVTGTWVRFEAGEGEGIYKIDYNFLNSAGIDPDEIDPRTIKIYNNGGKVLSENVNAPRPVDLVENAIKVIGEDDGKFDTEDYILFYGRGTDFWDYTESGGEVKRYHHPYSDKNYYWITYGGANGKRIQNKVGLNTTAEYNQNSTTAYADIEEDKINIGKTGREYYGDDYTQAIQSRTYINTLDGRIPSEPISYQFRFINASEGSLTLRLNESNTSIFSRILSGYGSLDYVVGTAYSFSAVYQGDLPDNRSVLNFNIVPTSVSTVGYLDYFEITYRKDLKASDDKLLFFSDDTSAVIEYYIHGFTSTNIEVYDVTDYSNIELVTNHVLLSGGDCRFQVLESKGNGSKYFALSSSNYLTPENPESIENSDLRGIQEGAKYIIITSKKFQDAANRLKTYRESEATVPVSTIVVDIDQIYNEFSCGMLDVSAVRDFIKYAYDNWTVSPDYVLLLGKGTFDYKDVEGYNDNFVPTWQTTESLRLLVSYTSDDFFVNIDSIDTNIDLAIGRVTASNETEANNYVTKVIDYEQNSKKGLWKNLITLVADDGYHDSANNEGAEHTRPSEIIANEKLPKSFDIKKIYLADYPVIITGAGRRKPQVNEDIINTINNGTLLINYIGHGNPKVWADEIVFDKNVTIPQLHNSEYFFLVAATCDFAYYDIPNSESGADNLLLLEDAGSIGSLNSARLVYSSLNQALNYQFITDVFSSPRDTLNLLRTMGESYFATKQVYNGTNDRKYHLFGDPLLRLQVPQYEGNIDSINGQPITIDVQIKALSSTEVEGTVLTAEREKWSDFDGEGILTVFDSERIKLLEQIGNYPMVIQGGVIFRGMVSVKNGVFKVNFVVPKDISYENKNGKIIFYFFDNEMDGLAYTRQVIVGGTDSTTTNDGEGPEIEIFFDNASYQNAYLVGLEPNLIVKLSDETGLNTTGTGIGHTLEGVLNNDQSNPIDFTNYFTGNLDAGGKSGEINYKFSKLVEGDYNLLIKAWDVFNNYSSEETNFSVVSDDRLVIRDVYNYPNPFNSNTTFTFQHNLNKPIDVNVKIYTIAGRMIKQIERENIDQKFVKIDWDGRDEDGDRLSNGTYLYKLIVKSADGEFRQNLLGKMAVIK